jgi:hypothetical protein
LNAKRSRVEAEHTQQYNCKDKACNCNSDFPASIIVEEATSIKYYFELLTSVITPKANKLKIPKMKAA